MEDSYLADIRGLMARYRVSNFEFPVFNFSFPVSKSEDLRMRNLRNHMGRLLSAALASSLFATALWA